MNAAAFRLLGTNLWTLRIVLFAAFIAWLPALFYVASRFLRPVAAAGIGLLAVVWSIPTYPGPMASWYNLFLATFGTAALLRYLEAPRRRWLVMAGVAGGLSILVKVIGLYYVAAVMLFLVFLARERMARGKGAALGECGQPTHAYAVFATASLGAFVVALVAVLRSHLHFTEFLQFLAPGALIAAFLARNEWAGVGARTRVRFSALAGLVLPFLAGVLAPVLLLTAFYARAGALRELVHGVFIAPQQRLSFLAVHAPEPWTLLSLVPFAALAALAYRVDGRLSRRELVLLSLALFLLLRFTGINGALYRTIWFAMRTLLPVLVIIGVALLGRARRDSDVPLLRAQTMLVLAITALCSLVQYPYTVSVYFGYVAPLVPLLCVAVYRHRPLAHRGIPLLVGAFLVAFAVLRTNGTRLASIGAEYRPQPALARLTLERGGIDVPAAEADIYTRLIVKLRSRARGGYTWASRDAPEIYFLAGLRNPTRTLFEVFDDPPSTSGQVMRNLEAHGITAIVLSAPSFSPPISAEMYALLTERFPHSEYVGPFQLRWRD